MELLLTPREVETLQRIKVDDRPDKTSIFLASVLAHLTPATGELTITVGQLAVARDLSRRWQHGLQAQFKAIDEAANRMGY